MNASARIVVPGLALALALSSPVGAQGSAADYERARTLRQRTSGKVTGGAVRPKWLPGGSRFWYRHDLGGGRRRFVLVDAGAKSRRPLFDHSRMAASLAKVTGKPVAADRLPIAGVAVEKGHVDLWLTGGTKAFRVDLASHRLSALPLADCKAFRLAPRPRVKRSRSSSQHSAVVFVNRTKKPMEVVWLATDGGERPYGRVAPGASKRQHTYQGHAWVVRTTDKKELGRFVAAAEPRVAWVDGKAKPPTSSRRRDRPPRRPASHRSPDGRWRVVFKWHNVRLQSLSTKKWHSLRTDGTQVDGFGGRVYWSPDSRRFVVFRTKPGLNREISFVESSPRNRLQPRLHTRRYTKPGDRIDHPRPWLFDVRKKSGVPVGGQLFANPWAIGNLRWEADSSAFSFLYNQRGHQVLRVVAVNAATGKARAVVDEVSKTFIDYAGKRYFHRLPETRELIWMSERDGWNHLYLYDARAGRVKNPITKGKWVVRGVDRIDAKARRLWFWAGGIVSGQDPYYRHYCRVNFNGSGLKVLTEGDGTHTVSFSPDRKFFFDTWSRVDLPPVTVLRRAADGALVCELERGDWSALLETGWKPPIRFVAKGRDGKTDIHGIIHRPSTFDAKKKYAVVEAIYAGPHSAHVPKGFRPNHGAQATAELGFVVVQIDGMGTSHRSKAFHDVCWKNIGDAGFPDRILWMKAAAKKYRWIDLTRVGIYGGSAGGQNAMRALIAHHDFYKVAVADCGCHDNRMDKIWWNELWMGWPVGPHYEQSSNVVQAHRMKGKLLLIVGEMDTNVDPASTMQVVNALVLADKDFDLVIIPGAGHGAAGTLYGRRRLRDHLVRHLLGVEPRWKSAARK